MIVDSVSDSHCPIRANELTLLTTALVFKCMKVNLEEHYTCLPCLSFITFKFIFLELAPTVYQSRKLFTNVSYYTRTQLRKLCKNSRQCKLNSLSSLLLESFVFVMIVKCLSLCGFFMLKSRSRRCTAILLVALIHLFRMTARVKQTRECPKELTKAGTLINHKWTLDSLLV